MGDQKMAYGVTMIAQKRGGNDEIKFLLSWKHGVNRNPLVPEAILLQLRCGGFGQRLNVDGVVPQRAIPIGRNVEFVRDFYRGAEIVLRHECVRQVVCRRTLRCAVERVAFHITGTLNRFRIPQILPDNEPRRVVPTVARLNGRRDESEVETLEFLIEHARGRRTRDNVHAAVDHARQLHRRRPDEGHRRDLDVFLIEHVSVNREKDR